MLYYSEPITAIQEEYTTKHINMLRNNSFNEFFNECRFEIDIVSLYLFFKYQLNATIVLTPEEESRYSKAIDAADCIYNLTETYPGFIVNVDNSTITASGYIDNLYVNYTARMISQKLTTDMYIQSRVVYDNIKNAAIASDYLNKMNHDRNVAVTSLYKEVNIETNMRSNYLYDIKSYELLSKINELVDNIRELTTQAEELKKARH